MDTKARKVLVVGATGGSGVAVVEQLLSQGHEVTAFARHAERLQARFPELKIINGNAMNPTEVESAVQGQDAVIVTLGISENPVQVRLFGSSHTPLDVRSAGTRNVIAAMRKHQVRKLVVLSSYGVGESRNKLPLATKLMFALLLKPQIADTEKQESLIRTSGLDWVIAQPVHLTNGYAHGQLFLSPAGKVRRMKISRGQVARFLAEAAGINTYVGRSVALSTT
ncbi:NAD(P)H-binding protein [Noviherbaspirillum sp. CPCC 100848]|uniref:NAD(P)H-binding protein n=1 Tax=Noviherbaspirillum album TaxID=3080276 RepID=A0ABU6JC98_9BURK|nr:NAD(P)H-binding protein [Noviherbaspirillum sp. CPCC 100848]MEC4721262.1 NAD(P)H-binding protein [Noviherbaspirillum sp. CPCC 100848]